MRNDNYRASMTRSAAKARDARLPLLDNAAALRYTRRAPAWTPR